MKIYDCELMKTMQTTVKTMSYINLLHEIVKYHKSGMLVHLNQHAALFMSYTLIHIRIIIFTDQCP